MREMQEEMNAEDISIDWEFDEEDNSGVWG